MYARVRAHARDKNHAYRNGLKITSPNLANLASGFSSARRHSSVSSIQRTTLRTDARSLENRPTLRLSHSSRQWANVFALLGGTNDLHARNDTRYRSSRSHLHAIVEGDWLIPSISREIELARRFVHRRLAADSNLTCSPMALGKSDSTNGPTSIVELVRQAIRPLDNTHQVACLFVACASSVASAYAAFASRFQCYSTSTWEESVHRLGNKPNRQRKRYSRVDRWAATVSRNHNRKGN